MIETLRISETGKKHLVTLKRHTGIENWNTLCRWGFCLSLLDPSPLVIETQSKKSNVEMTWRTFTGQFDAVYTALLVHARSRPDATETDGIPIEDLATMHIERGLARLLPSTKSNGISGLLSIANC